VADRLVVLSACSLDSSAATYNPTLPARSSRNRRPKL